MGFEPISITISILDLANQYSNQLSDLSYYRLDSSVVEHWTENPATVVQFHFRAKNYLSISPKTISAVPITVTKSANIYLLVNRFKPCR